MNFQPHSFASPARRLQTPWGALAATLTGARVIAPGHVRSGLYANGDALGNALIAEGDKVDDPTWRMPLDRAGQ